jgi:uncharacterized membrane protein YcaP (DUF421 family)
MYNYLWDHFFKIDWNSMINPGISILEKGIRAIIIYFVLILGLRIVGKRELAQLNPFDIVVLFLLSNTVQNALIGNDNSLTGGITGAVALFVINYVIVRFIYDNNKAANVLEGSLDILIENGIVKVDSLKKELITLSELEMAARKQGFESLNEIERSEIDPDGAISFIAKKPTPQEEHYAELLSKIDNLCQEVKFLKDKIEKNT